MAKYFFEKDQKLFCLDDETGELTELKKEKIVSADDAMIKTIAQVLTGKKESRKIE